MIRAEFVIRDNKIQSFSTKGHAGLAPAPHDVLCAAVSAMAMLTVNNITDSFGVPATVSVEEESATIDLSLDNGDERGCILIAGFKRELEILAEDYPDHVRIN